ncbi:MAG TPA: MBL fold metallo-hydrolase [Beijerinckiaceae bacterium]|jgi:glyoxylase-like metal-dependent hydrolase (beta-lactamase superfamily II)
MRVHHLNCGLMRPPGGALFDGVSAGLTARLTCHCLLVETDEGLVLVDTGFGTKDMAAPDERISPFFVWLDNIQLDPELTALAQVEALGFSLRDVRHVVMTHLDFDHAGGLSDFPWATVHVSRRELEVATRRQGPRESRRYSKAQLDDVRRWETYETGGGRWFGFEAVRELNGLPPEILLVALPGHTEGHAGVAIDLGEGWLLHAGDAYFHRHEMDRPERECPPATRGYQRMMAADYGLHLENQARLRELYQDPRQPIAVFCTHDPVEFEALRDLNIASSLPTRGSAGRSESRDRVSRDGRAASP